MAQRIGICGVRLTPLAQALEDFIVGHDMVHADETPIKLLAPGQALQSQGVTDAPCRAHARRTLFEARQFNGSAIAGWRSR